MASTTAVVAVTIDTAVTTTDFVMPGFGTPKAVELFWSRDDPPESVITSYCTFGVGVFDGTRNHAAMSRTRNGASTSECENYGASTNCYGLIATTTQTITDLATGSFITDGFRLTFSVAPARAAEVVCILYGGSDMLARAGLFNATVADDDITDPAFKPSLVKIFGTRQEIDDTFGTPSNRFSYGVVSQNSDVVVQRNISYDDPDNVGTSTLAMSINNNSAMNETTVSGIGHTAVLSGFDANGFTVEFDDGASAGHQGIYLALKPGTLLTYVGDFAMPTSTGTDVQTGVGFRPQIIGTLPSRVTAFNTLKTDLSASNWSFGAGTRLDSAYLSLSSEDAAATMVTFQNAGRHILHLLDEDGTETDFAKASLQSLDSDGFSFYWHDKITTAGNVLVWAIQEESEVLGPRFVDSRANVEVNGTGANVASLAINVPAATVDGDFLLLSGCADGAGNTFVTPAGWTELDNRSGGDVGGLLAYRKASSEPASYTVSLTSGINQIALIMVRVTGQEATSPIDASAFSSGVMVVGTPNTHGKTPAQGVTTTVANCLVFEWSAYDDDDDKPGTHVPGHAVGIRTDLTTESIPFYGFDASGNVIQTGLGHFTQVAAGATPNASSNEDEQWIIIAGSANGALEDFVKGTVAIAPAAAVDGIPHLIMSGKENTRNAVMIRGRRAQKEEQDRLGVWQ